MKRLLIALSIGAMALPIGPAIAGGTGNQLVGYYSPDVTRLVEGQPIFPSDAHRQNVLGVPIPQPAGLPTILTQLRGVNIDGLARQNGRFVFSIDVAAAIGGSTYFPGDVIRCDDALCGSRTLLLDAFTDLPRNINVDGVGFDRSTGELLYSIEADASYADTYFFSTDIIRFNGNSHQIAFDGRRLPPGANVDGLDGTADGFLLSTDADAIASNPAPPFLLTRSHTIIAYDSNTQIFSFPGFLPAGNWDGANVDAFYGGTLDDADTIFANGFDGL